MPDGIPKHHKPLLLQPLLSLLLQSSIPHLVLLSTACPTSLASDQTKGGGRPGVQRTPRFGAREQKIRSDEDTALSKLSPKIQKKLPRSFVMRQESPERRGSSRSQILKASLQRLHCLYIYHTEKRSGRATPEIFLFLSVPCGGSFTHVVRVHVEPHALRVSVDCLTEYLNTISLYCYSHY